MGPLKVDVPSEDHLPLTLTFPSITNDMPIKVTAQLFGDHHDLAVFRPGEHAFSMMGHRFLCAFATLEDFEVVVKICLERANHHSELTVPQGSRWIAR